jgi:hypothetical protein
MRMFNNVPKHQKGRLYGCGGKSPDMVTVFTRRGKFRSFYVQENIQDAPLERDLRAETNAAIQKEFLLRLGIKHRPANRHEVMTYLNTEKNEHNLLFKWVKNNYSFCLMAEHRIMDMS